MDSGTWLGDDVSRWDPRHDKLARMTRESSRHRIFSVRAQISQIMCFGRLDEIFTMAPFILTYNDFSFWIFQMHIYFRLIHIKDVFVYN